MPRTLSGAFAKPFPAQLAAFRLRLGNLVPTSRWDDLQRGQHDRGFMVAGATQADLLEDLAKAVDRAISEGRGFDAFKSEFRNIVEKRGWHGWTGEGTEAGENWRMRTIYRTNMRTSYMAGRHAQLVDGNYKYWVYRHSGAVHPRLDHLSWDGITLPPDHPFWITHYGPNGWGCGCLVRGANSDRRVAKVGGDLSIPLPDGWNVRDPKTGTFPGIGKLWDYAPGASVDQLVNSLRPKLEGLPDQASIATIQSWLNHSAFANWFDNPIGNWPLLKISTDAAARIQSKQRVAVLSPQSLAKQKLNHPDLTVQDYARAQQAVSTADHVVRQDKNHLIFIKHVEGEPGYVLVVKAVTENDELFVQSVRRLSSKQAKLDREIQALIGTGV
jgi:hypothetical protein